MLSNVDYEFVLLLISHVLLAVVTYHIGRWRERVLFQREEQEMRVVRLERYRQKRATDIDELKIPAVCRRRRDA